MKKISILVALLLSLALATPVVAGNESNMKVVLDQEALMELDSNTRNTVLKAIQAQQEAATALVNEASVEKTMEMIAGVNLDEFQGKAIAIADAINVFCEKLGVTVNDFITTPAGNFIIFGGLWKLGVFGSIWGFFKGFGCVGVLLWLLFNLNTRKKVTLNEKDHEGKIVRSVESLVPRFTAVFSDSKDEHSAYSIIGSIIIMVLLFLTVCFVI